MFLESGCSSVARHGGGGVTAQWAGMREIVAGGGVNSGVSSASKNRPSHHKYKSPKQFELKQS